MTRSPKPKPRQPTARQIEVLQLLAAGFSAHEIAQMLAIAPSTVQRHVSNLKARTQARNRTQLIAQAINDGTIGVDGQR